MSIEQLANDELVENQLRGELHAHGEPLIDTAWAVAGRSDEIKIDGSDRILNASASSGNKIVYVMLILSVLAAIGGPWMIMNMSGLPFGLASSETSPGSRLSSSPDHNTNATSDRMTATSDRVPQIQERDRLQVHDTIAGNVDRDALAATLQSLNLASASTASLGTTPSKHSTGVQRTGGRAEELRSPTKPPTPETRPTTIPGWTLREVSNGTAVLEGPNGIWRVTPGQKVPGLGKVDSVVRWGNRLIVATSSGLISTP
jgi:hypothetical protein